MRAGFQRLWNESPVLMVMSLLMLATFIGSAIGVFLDPRMVTGAPAWLKPAKFGISAAIYGVTLAWLYRYLRVWRGFLRFLAWSTSLVLIAEIAIIDVQAGRGVISHFNNATNLDRALFGIMGVGIVILWLSGVGILAALFKQRFDDPAWGWALRLGMLVTVLGSASGGFMLAPKQDQLQAMHQHKQAAAIGGHTVGAPDGGPGIPGVGWSTEHGDLRVPHFIGLHGVQIIPLFAWLFARRRVSAVFIAAASYVGLFAILVWQALKGESIVAPDGTTLAVLGIWAAATAVALVATSRRTAGHATAHGYSA